MPKIDANSDAAQRMKALTEKCKDNIECLQREIVEEKKKALIQTDAVCAKGDQNACYASELMKLQ